MTTVELKPGLSGPFKNALDADPTDLTARLALYDYLLEQGLTEADLEGLAWINARKAHPDLSWTEWWWFLLSGQVVPRVVRVAMDKVSRDYNHPARTGSWAIERAVLAWLGLSPAVRDGCRRWQAEGDDVWLGQIR